jgi:long-subunit fatty acid transport protein
VSYGRFNTVVKPSLSPYFSWLYEHNKSQNLSLVVRAPSQYKLDLQTRSDARVLGGGSSTPINLNASSILYYEPLSIHLSHSILLSRNFTLFSELEYQNSSKTKAPTLSIQDENSAFQIINSVDSSPKFQDILIPKLGLNYEVNEVLSTRFGYYFKKSIVKDNSGSGNIVDPSKHVFSLGAGFDLKNAKLTDKSISLDFYTQFHWLLKTTIQKSQNNEANNSSSQKIGSPTFLAGGKIYSLGISISMLF